MLVYFYTLNELKIKYGKNLVIYDATVHHTDFTGGVDLFFDFKYLGRVNDVKLENDYYVLSSPNNDLFIPTWAAEDIGKNTIFEVI